MVCMVLSSKFYIQCLCFLAISGQFVVGFRAGKILGGKVSTLEGFDSNLVP